MTMFATPAMKAEMAKLKAFFLGAIPVGFDDESMATALAMCVRHSMPDTHAVRVIVRHRGSEAFKAYGLMDPPPKKAPPVPPAQQPMDFSGLHHRNLPLEAEPVAEPKAEPKVEPKPAEAPAPRPEGRVARPPIEVKLNKSPKIAAPAVPDLVDLGYVVPTDPKKSKPGDPDYAFPPAVLGKKRRPHCIVPVAVAHPTQLIRYPSGTRFRAFDIAAAMRVKIGKGKDCDFRSWMAFNYFLLREGYPAGLCRAIRPSGTLCTTASPVGDSQVWVVDHFEARRRLSIPRPTDHKIEQTLPAGKQPLDSYGTVISEREYEPNRGAGNGGRKRRIDARYKPRTGASITEPLPQPAPQPAPQPGKFADLHRQTVDHIANMGGGASELRKVTPNGHAGD